MGGTPALAVSGQHRSRGRQSGCTGWPGDRGLFHSLLAILDRQLGWREPQRRHGPGRGGFGRIRLPAPAHGRRMADPGRIQAVRPGLVHQ